MELNQTEPQHHDVASTGMKAILLIFAIVLIGVLVYMVWFMPEEETDLGGGVTIKRSRTPTPRVTSTATLEATETATPSATLTPTRTPRATVTSEVD